MQSLSALLTGAIDYAGLFPPASLSMPEAVAEYAHHRASPERWALHRFVVAAIRLKEFAEVARPWLLDPPVGGPWRLSCVASGNVPAEMAHVRAFNEAFDPSVAIVDAMEFRADTVGTLEGILRQVPPGFERFVEIPLASPPTALLEAVRRVEGRAKIRTGGTAAESFPLADHLLRFLVEAVRLGVPFKATAGLHHGVCGTYPYTYADDTARGPMFGYLNLLVTTALLRHGVAPGEARAALLETVPEAFTFDAAGLTWRGHALSLADLAATRRDGMLSWGSCSFREPMDELAIFAAAVP